MKTLIVLIGMMIVSCASIQDFATGTDKLLIRDGYADQEHGFVISYEINKIDTVTYDVSSKLRKQGHTTILSLSDTTIDYSMIDTVLDRQWKKHLERIREIKRKFSE